MKLRGKTVAILVEKDYQDLEVWYPALRLREEGTRMVLLGTGAKDYRGKYGYPAVVDQSVAQAVPKNFDAVIIPGGWAPDFLRRSEAVLRFVRGIHRLGRPVAAICHGGWVLSSAGLLKGRTVTSFSAIKDDLIHAGAHWVDREVVVDGNLITARTPEDLPAFCRELIRALDQAPMPRKK